MATVSEAKPTRRTLHFTSIEQVIAEVQKLADADSKGTLRCTGNWTFGQNLDHLATWVDYAYDGAPIKIPFFIRWAMKPMKNRMLNQPMKPGARIPWVPGGTLAIDVVSTPDGLAHFQKAFARLTQEVPTQPNPLLGPLTHAEWTSLHLRHAELHLSFLRPE